MLSEYSGDLIIKSVGNNYSYEDGLLIDKSNKELVLYQSKNNKLEIPNCIKKIGKAAFSGCTSLEEIVIPDSVKEIGPGAFEGCTSLEQIVIPASVTKIDDGTFNGCTSLQQIVIPDSVTEIGEEDFWDCTASQEFVLPQSLAINDADIVGASSTCKVIRK